MITAEQAKQIASEPVNPVNLQEAKVKINNYIQQASILGLTTIEYTCGDDVKLGIQLLIDLKELGYDVALTPRSDRLLIRW